MKEKTRKEIQAYIENTTPKTPFSMLLSDVFDGTMEQRLCAVGFESVEIEVEWGKESKDVFISAMHHRYQWALEFDEEEYIVYNYDDIDEEENEDEDEVDYLPLSSSEDFYRAAEAALLPYEYKYNTVQIVHTEPKTSTSKIKARLLAVAAILFGILMYYLDVQGSIVIEGMDDAKWLFCALPILCGVGLLSIDVISTVSKKRAEASVAEQTEKMRVNASASHALRRADPSVKHTSLAEAKHEMYHIVYRRVKSTNELIVNGFVYDEKKGILEFNHILLAVLDGHQIQAGLDTANGISFIKFDGETIATKERSI